MRAKRTQQGGLARAHDRIEFLLHELNTTIVDVEQMSPGEEEEALRRIEEQREMLYRTVEQIAGDVARHTPSRFELFRRHLVSASAAAAIAMLVVAGGVTAMRGGDDPISTARTELARAATISDPVERLHVIVTVYRTTRALPASSKLMLDREIVEQANKTAEDANEDDDDDVAKHAKQIAEDVQSGRMPAPPPAPSGDTPPTEAVDELLGM